MRLLLVQINLLNYKHNQRKTRKENNYCLEELLHLYLPQQAAVISPGQFLLHTLL